MTRTDTPARRPAAGRVVVLFVALALLSSASCGSAAPLEHQMDNNGPTTPAPDTEAGIGTGTDAVAESVTDEAGDSVFSIEVTTCPPSTRATAGSVAVAEDLLVTVAHTFDQARWFRVVNARGDTLVAEVIHLDADRDLALIAVDNRTVTAVPLGDSADGAPLAIVTPAGDNQPRPATILRHVDASLDGRGERRAVEVAADIAIGDSGSPAVNAAGEVVGIVFAADRNEARGWLVATAEIEVALAQPQGDPISFSCD